MATVNLPFAASGTRRAPNSSELASGFPCGEADRELFNWLMWFATGQVSNLADASGYSVDDAALTALLQSVRSQRVNYTVVGGTSSAITASLSPAPTSLPNGLPLNLDFAALFASAGATLNVNGLGAEPILTMRGQPIAENDIPVGALVRVIKCDAGWMMTGPSYSEIVRTGVQSYLTAGTSTWTVPDGVYWVYGIVVGGGGGGGAGAGSATWSAGGGGSGGRSEGWVPVTPGQTITVTVGAGGAGAPAGSASGVLASSGGTSSFGSYMSATGGAGGTGGTTTSAGGNGGVGSGGQINIRGGVGGDGNPANREVQGGAGAASSLGGGGRTATGASGIDATANGAGGGGVWSSSSTAQRGGNGAPGAVILTW